MKILRQTIRKLLINEARCAEATKKIQNAIEFMHANNMYIKFYKGYFGGLEIRLVQEYKVGDYEPELRERGMLDAVKLEPAHVISYTEIDRDLEGLGLGALLYDVAVEMVTQMGSYLACDREEVSKSARRMWKYYASSNDYEALQMDLYPSHYNQKVFLTPEDDDDISHEIFLRISGARIEEPTFKEEFLASPFTKAYRKKRITTLPCIKDRLIEE